LSATPTGKLTADWFATHLLPGSAVATLIGTDEAGYGPNLGPLVISASVWEIPDGVAADGLYDLLGDVVTQSPAARAGKRSAAAGAGPPPKIPIADSKVLYQSGGGLANLERGLLAALAVLDRRPACWREAWQSLSPESVPVCRAVPWHDGFDIPLPLGAEPAEIELLGPALASGLAAAGVRLVDVRSRAIFPEEFNGLVAAAGSKGSLLSHATLELAARLAATLGPGSIRIICDKHGGRNRYAPLVEEHFPGWLVEIYGEGRRRSVYRFGPAERRVEISFQTKAESCLPVALASMASKYLRELSMHALNAFWCGRIDGLRPTAGYPGDAKRFKASITALQTELGIEDAVLWREK
jgi:hypothetical protein